MVAKENLDVIEGRQRVSDVDVLESEEASEDASIVYDGSALDEEDGSSLVWAGVTEEVKDMQKDLKYFSILYYMLKPSHLLIGALRTI